MYVQKLSLKIVCLAIMAIGLVISLSTQNLMKNNIATVFAQPVATTTTNTKDVLSTFPFKPGILVMPMTCSTPNDIMKSHHMATNNATTTNSFFSNYFKNQMMLFSGTSKNMTASQIKQGLNMEVCYPSTFSLIKHFFSDNKSMP